MICELKSKEFQSTTSLPKRLNTKACDSQKARANRYQLQEVVRSESNQHHRISKCELHDLKMVIWLQISLLLLVQFFRFGQFASIPERFEEELSFSQLSASELMSHFRFTIGRNVTGDEERMKTAMKPRVEVSFLLNLSVLLLLFL
jgi:hypothetical protein